MERVDLAAASAHAIVRLERAVEEGAVPTRRVIVGERYVVIPQDAVGDHQVVRLVPLRAHLDLRARRDH